MELETCVLGKLAQDALFAMRDPCATCEHPDECRIRYPGCLDVESEPDPEWREGDHEP